MARKREQLNDTFQFHLEPRTEAQKRALEIYQENDITFFIGPAGVGKSLLAVYCALYDRFKPIKSRRVDKIIITRPIVEAGEKLGFLPGEVNEKVHPYMLPIYEAVSKMVYNSDEFIIKNFEVAPLAYLRGKNFENCVAILDEAQNCTMKHMKLFLSRMCHTCKIIITGDPDQSDINSHSALRPTVDAIKGIAGIGIFEFKEADIVRHPLVREILKRLPK